MGLHQLARGEFASYIILIFGIMILLEEVIATPVYSYILIQ